MSSTYKPEKMILTAGPSITDLEIGYVNDAVKNGWNENWNGYLQRFESSFASFIGSTHAMTTSSCTGALHLSLLALGIGEGDEVIVPELTWVATASAVMYVGAMPVFCDVDPESWCIDIESAESVLTEQTRAIMPVHLYGHPAEMQALMAFADDNDLKVIEDAAPAIGARVNGELAGSFGDISCFSFQGAKVLVTGEGGMLTTSDEELYRRCLKLGDHGRSLTVPLWNDELGYKYKMSNLQAALGLAQLERVDELVQQKRWINSIYARELEGVNGIRVTSDKAGCEGIHWMTSIEIAGCDKEKRSEIMGELKDRLVDSRPVFSPLSTMPMFERNAENPNAYRIGESAINLPSGHNLSEAELVYICDQLKAILV